MKYIKKPWFCFLLPVALAFTTRLSTHPHDLIWIIVRWVAIIPLVLLGIRKKSVPSWVFIMMVLGIEFGDDFPSYALHLKILSDIFLKLLKAIIAPLIFGTLVVGIAGHADIKSVGRMGIKVLVYFEVVTTIALFIGFAAINISKAGVGVTVPKTTEKLQIAEQTVEYLILHAFPENFAKSIAEGEVLQVVIFSILFACAVALLPEEKKKPMLSFAESLSETMFKFTHIIMHLAPLAAGSAIAYTIAQNGPSIFYNLVELLLTLYLALIAFVILVFIPILLIIKVPLKDFFKTVSEPAILAFATSSSESALPLAIKRMGSFGVPKKIASFVLLTGYSFNLDGTTLYLSLASIFVAQAGGVHMTFTEELFMLFTLLLTSKGVAGVPRASLVVLSGTIAFFHLPPEPFFVLIGIDALMNMGRAAINVMGNCLASMVIAKWEGELTVIKSPA